MSAQTQLYLYNQRQTVVLLSTNLNLANRRWETVYAKELTITRGTVNAIEFAFINQDQKPVNLSRVQTVDTDPNFQSLMFRIISKDGSTLLMEKQLTPVYALTGIYRLNLTVDETLMLDPQNGYYSIQSLETGKPVYVDAKAGGRGVIKIEDSVFPDIVKTTELTIPTHAINYDVVPAKYYSTVLVNTASGLSTIVVYFNHFTGEVQIEGSQLADFGTVYNIGALKTYTDKSGTEVWLDVEGLHPFVRLNIKNNGTRNPLDSTVRPFGDIVKVLVR